MELAKETSISGVLDVQHGIVLPPGVLQTLLPEVSSILKDAVTASSEEKQNQNNVLNQPSSILLRHVSLFCKVCDKLCANRSVLNCHMNQHYTENNVKKIDCKSCKLRQTCVKEVVHMERYVAYFANCYSCMKSLSMFICKQCGKSFLSLEEVITHVESGTKCKKKKKNNFSLISHKQSHRGTTEKPRKVSKPIDVIADVKELKSYSNRNYLKHSEDLNRLKIDRDIEKRAIEKDINDYLTKKSNHICVMEKIKNTKMTENTKEISEFTNIEHGIVQIKEEPSNAEFQDTAKRKHEKILATYISKKTDHRELVNETDTKMNKVTKKPFALTYTEHGIVNIKEEPSNVEFLDTVKNKQEKILVKYLSNKTDHRELAYETDTKFTEDAEEPSESINSDHGIVTIKEEPSNVEFLDTAKKKQEVLDKYLSKKTDHRELAYETDTKFTEDTEEPPESINSEHGIVNVKEEPSNFEFLDTAKKKQEEDLDKHLSKKTDHRELVYETDTKFTEDAEEPSESINSEHGIVTIKEEPSNVEFLYTAKKKQEDDLDNYLSRKTDHRELAYETDTKFTEDTEEPSESIHSEHGIVNIKEEPSNVEFLYTAKKKQEDDLDNYLSRKTDHRELAYETDTKFTEDTEEPSESIHSEHGIVNIKEEPSNVEFLDKYLVKNTNHREVEVERDTKTYEDAKNLSELVYMEPDIINVKEESSDVEFVSVEETSAEEKEFGSNQGKLSDIEFMSSGETSSTVEREFGRDPGKSPDVEFLSVEKTTSTDEREFGLNPGKSSVIEFVSSEGTSSTVVKESSKNPGKGKYFKLICLTHQPKVSTVFKDASTAGSNSSKEKQIHKTVFNELACRNCAMCFSTQQELQEHIHKHGYTCKKCYEPFNSNKDLLRHFCLFCKQCEKVLNTKANFLVHMKKHAAIKKKTLVSTLSKNDSLIKCNLIVNNYFKRQDYWCDTCKEGFDDDFSFTSHKRFHGGPAKSYAVRKAPKLADATADGKTKLPGDKVEVDIESSDLEFIKPETCTYNRNFSSNNIPREKLKKRHWNLISDGGKCEQFAEPELVKIEPSELL